MSSRAERRRAAKKMKRRELKLEELQAIVERARVLGLTEEEHATLAAAVETLAFLTQELRGEGDDTRAAAADAVRAATEKTSQVVGEAPRTGPALRARRGRRAGAAHATGSPRRRATAATARRPTRGRRRSRCRTPPCTAATRAPACQKGKVYPLSEPAVLVRVQGMAPLAATVYELRASALQPVRRGVHAPRRRRAWATRSTTRRRRA